MPTYFDKRLRLCRDCGTRPALEHWASGGPMYAVRCDNPHRPETCSEAFYFSETRNPEETIARWNFYQSAPWRHDRITREWLGRHMEELRDIETATIDLLTEAVTYCRTIEDNPIASEIAKRAGHVMDYDRAALDEKGKILRAAAASFGIRLI